MNAPLNERDFAEIRANVLREIARRQRRNVFVLAGAVVFAVLAVVFVLVPRPVPQRNRGGEAASAPLRTAPAPAAQPSLHGAEAAAPPLIAAVRRPHKNHHRKPAAPPPVAIASIELHTANPDIRIIWIPNKETE